MEPILACTKARSIRTWKPYKYKPGAPTYYWILPDGRVIDGQNDFRFMNHSCDPNAVATEEVVNGVVQIVFRTLKKVPAGSELLLDYQLQKSKGDRHRYVCSCGARKCRGTMLA